MATASQPAYFNLQLLASDGSLAASMRLYTYTAGTTTHKIAYTEPTATVPHTYTSDGGGGQYIALNARGELPAPLYLTSGAYDLCLKTSAGVTTWTRRTQGVDDTPTTNDSALRADLVSTATTKGGALIGINDAGGYINGTTVEAALQEVASPTGKFRADGVNVLRYIPVAEWAAILAGTSTTNLATYLQTAITAEPNLYFPRGQYTTGAALNMRVDSHIYGDGVYASRINGTHAGTIFLYPINNHGCTVEDLAFSGAGCTGVAVATTAGTMQGYLYGAVIQRCSFWYEMDFGVNAQLLLTTIADCWFGRQGSAINTTNGFCGIKAYQYYQPVNSNRIVRCGFENTGGAGLRCALWLYGCTSMLVDQCDFEGCGGRPIIINFGGLIELRNCWFERNGGSSPSTPYTVASMILIDGTYDLVKITRCSMGATVTNSTNSVIEWVGSTSGGVEVRGCTFSLQPTQYPLYDNAAVNYGLDGAGRVVWESNYVIDGNAANKLTTDINKGAKSTVRGWAVISTGAPSINAASDGTLISISKTGTGDVTLTMPSAIGSSPSSICVVASALDVSNATILAVASTTKTIRIVQRVSGVVTDGQISVMWAGV